MNCLRTALQRTWWLLTVAGCLPPADDVAHVVIMPEDAVIVTGDSLLLLAEVRDVGDHFTGNQPDAWASLDTMDATVSQSGRVVGQGQGTTSVADL